MAHYNFDKVIIRKGSGALKYDALKERYGNSDLWPLWVADMDFETPDFIINALRNRLDHPIFGYTIVPEEFWTSIIDWIGNRHQWEIKREWLNYIPGIVKGIGFVINKFTNPGDNVIIQPPVYHPFRLLSQGNGRNVVNNPLIEVTEGNYKMNLEQLEELASNEKTKLLILSNPHNPIGIVWDEETLRKVAEICFDNGVLVISDEIHCDLALWGNRYHPFAKVSEKASACSISFGSPSKTFNIAGIVSSYSIVPNDKIRQQFYSWLDVNEFSEPNIFSIISTIAAFTKGEEWRKEMLEYVEKNINFTIDYCKKNIPEVIALRPEASFLLWLDCRKLNLSHEELIDLFVKRAELALNDGEMFGIEGRGFMRMNVAAPKIIVEHALQRLEKAIKEIKNKKE